MPSTRQIRALLAATACVLWGAVAQAQVTLDPRTAEFDPSPDHNSPTLVVRYDLELYFVGAPSPFQTVSLGKPAPQGDGKIRVDLATVLGAFLPAGTNYESRVTAVSDTSEVGRSDLSNQFAFTASCAATISPLSSSVGGGAGTGLLTVSAAAGCTWTASSMVSWITITGGATGTGNGTVTYSVTANPTTTPRTGTVAAAGQTFTLTQAGACSFNISPTSASWSASAATGSVAVTTTAGCSWSASSPVSWITFTGPTSGTGNGTVTYSVAANTSSTARNATLSIAGRAFAVNQAGVACTPSLSATGVTVGAGGGPGTVGVTAAAGCTWTASSGASWLTVTGGSPGNGNGTVSYNVAPNGTASSRTGTLTIAGQTYTVTQQSVTCTFSISPTSGNVPSTASTGSVSVTAPGGCAWTAVSGAAWITVTSGASGSGNGTVGYSVAANTSVTPRSGSVTIAGQTFTINQAAAPCTFTISPTSASAPSGASNGSIAVTVATGCSWTAGTNAPWITVTSGTPGNGNGTVNYSIAANSGILSRSGAITIAGRTFSVTQAGIPCTFTISPSGASVGAGATSGSVAVTAPAGCTWSATSNQTWATITGGATGSGNGTVSYNVGANGTPSPRGATLTIAGQSFALTQAGGSCNFTVAPASDNVPPVGGSNRTINVSVQTGCAWTATPSASWITITAGGLGSGNGVVTYQVAANTSISQRSATIAIGSQIVTVTQQGASCSYSLTPASVSVGSSSTTGTVTVTAQAGCAWTATSSAGWITVTGGTGTGNGSFSYAIAANPSATARIGSVSVAGQTFTVNQSGIPCIYSIAPTGASVNAGATSGTVAVSTDPGCGWSATSSASWITVTSGTPGSGAGTVSYNVAANPSTAGRSGTVTIAGHAFTVTQAGVVCTFSVSPTTTTLSAAATSLPINVTTGGSCAWSASSSVSWITLASGGGPGTGNATFSVAANTTGAQRSGTLTVAGQTVNVTQVGGTCSYSTSLFLVEVGADATTIPVTVTTQGNCPWSSSSPVSWATFPSGGTGTGSGTVTVAVEPNPGSPGRLATLTIAGRPLTINQAARLCSYSLNPTAVSVGPEATTGSFAVTASAGCAWTPTTSATWVALSGGGSGNGTVTYTVMQNTTGASRTATVTVGSRSFTITQSGPCAYSISPTDVSLGEPATSGTVSVTTSAGCSWNASSAASWITITSGASGTGNGSVNYSVAANPGGASRTGTLNIAGDVFTVVQSSCDLTVTPPTVNAAAGGGTSYALVRAGPSCSWSATSSGSWISFPGATSGSGVDWVQFLVGANSSTSTRTGTITISGETIAVVQAGSCTFTVSPQTLSVGGASTVQTVALSTSTSCTWTASSQVSWITINPGSTSGTGSATPVFTVAANSGSTSRTGTVRIGGVTVLVFQAPGGPLTTPAGLRVIK
jgi:hypothetical protein